MGRVTEPRRPRVVVLGAGFAGLWAARELAHQPVDALLIDRNNYHTFLPLVYQVAAAELEPGSTVNPVRSILRHLPNVRFVMTDVERIDPTRRVLVCRGEAIPFDYLILAPGSTPEYFGIPGADEHAFPLRTLEHGVTLRNHILTCFERAVAEPDHSRRAPLLTFVIVGGGATGIEFAGSLAELVQGPLRKDFHELDPSEIHIVLLEAADRVLLGYPERLGAYARERLGRLDVEVRLGATAARIGADALLLKEGVPIRTHTVVWTAGHRGHPLAEASGLPTNRKGQVSVGPTLQIAQHPEIYVAGDLAGFEQDGQPLPMVAPVAMQEGTAAARNILRQIGGNPLVPFHYRDKGMLAVIGRNAAVARLWRRAFTGFPAWVLWGVVHIVQLIGFRNRLLVLLGWLWDYVLYERAVRLILPARRQGEVDASRRPNRSQHVDTTAKSGL